MAFDVARGNAVLFGGHGLVVPVIGGRPVLDDTWTNARGRWQRVLPASTPRAREAAAMAYDLGRARCVLVGGMGAFGPLDDTWQWDGANWANVTPAVRPSARAGGLFSRLQHEMRGRDACHQGNSRLIVKP